MNYILDCIETIKRLNHLKTIYVNPAEYLERILKIGKSIRHFFGTNGYEGKYFLFRAYVFINEL